MSGKLRIRRGTHAELPPLGIGEEAYTLDDKVLSIGGLSGNEPIGGGGSQGATGLPGAGYMPNEYLVPAVYPTIQAAINQAFADGHTASTNTAIVSIAPGTYNESLILKSGVSLRGAGGSATYVFGNAIYQPSINQSQGLNSIVLSSLTLHSNIAGSALVVSGSFAAKITATDCTIRKDAGDTATCLIFNNSQGQLTLDDTSIFHLDPGGVQLDLQAGNMGVKNGSTICNQAITYTVNLVKVAGQASFDNSYVGTSSHTNNGAPSLIEVYSTIAQCFVDYCTVINGLPGSNHFFFSANGMIQVRHSDVFNNFGVGATTFALGAAGILRVGHNAMDANYVAPGITLQHAGPYQDMNFDVSINTIYVGGERGFRTVTDALSYAVAHGLNYARIILAPGGYTENIVIPSNINVQIKADNANFSDTDLFGSITFNPTAPAHLELINISVFAGAGQSCLSVGGTASAFLNIADCNFQSVSGATMMLFTNTQSSSYAVISGSYFNQSNSSEPMFDIAMPNINLTGINIYGNIEVFSNNFPLYDPLISSPMFIIRSTAGYLPMRNFDINCEVDTLFKLEAGANLYFEDCLVSQTTNFGTMFYFEGNAGVNANYVQFNISSNPGQPEFVSQGGAASLARDGVAAAGTINAVNNSISAGNSVTVGSKTFVAGTDFAVGGSSAATALNLAVAINNSYQSAGAIAIVNSNAVELYAFVFGTAGNSVALSTNAPGQFSVSGSTLTGGTNGSGGGMTANCCNFQYGSAQNFQNTISLNYGVNTLSGGNDVDVSGNAVTFQPGGTNSGSVYTTWSAAYTALSNIAGPKTLFVDDSFSSPAVMPAGTYNFTNTQFVGINRTASRAQLTLASNVFTTGFNSFKNLAIVSNGMVVEQTGVIGVYTTYALTLDNSSVQNNGSNIIWNLNNAAVSVYLLNSSSFITSSTGPTPQPHVLSIGRVTGGDIPQPANIYLYSGANVQTYTLEGEPTSTYTWNVLATDVQYSQVHGNYHQTYSTVIDTAATNLGYTPATPGNWAGTPPSTTQQAIDRLAAKVFAGFGNTPIP